MAEPPEPTPLEVTLRGHPDPAEGAPAPRGRPLVRRALLVAAGLAVVAAAVLSQRADQPAPERECPYECVEPGAVVVGATLPLTGPLAPVGSAQRRGVERELGRVAAAGGLELEGGRRRVQLLVRDTRSQPDVAGQEALVLVRGPFRLSALLGPCTPPAPVARMAESRRVPLVTGCQPLPDLGGSERRHTWEVAPGEPERAAAVFEALRTSASRRAGLFLSNDRLEATWRTAAQQAGFDVVGTYRPQGSDWAAAVTQAAADEVEVVVAVTQPPEGAGLWRELRRQGVEPQSSYASEAGLGSAWRVAVGRDGDGTLTDLVHPSLPESATPEQVDDAVATVSSELTRVLLDGLRRAGTAERSDLLAALTGATAEVAGRDVRFRGDHTSRLPARLATWQDGRLVHVPR